jgi:peptidyl-prolyl cis-trans isomerase SurA
MQKQMRRTSIVLGLVMGASLIGACQRSAPAPSSPDVWAMVDGREIHRDQVERAYRGSVDPASPPASSEEALALKLNLLEELITQDILLDRARTLGLMATDADVETALAERRQSITEDAFQQQLQESGLTLDEIKEGLQRELSVQRVLEREVSSKVTVSDQDVSEFFTANREQFNLAEPQYRLAQIIVTPQRNADLQNRMHDDAATADEARQKAEMLTRRLQDGADFGELALDYSEDPQSLAQGGDVGFVPESALGQISPQLRDAVKRMEPGSVHAVNLGGNYMILMLLAQEPAGQRDLSTPSVQENIRQLLVGRQENLLHTAFLTMARDTADVTNFLARQVVDAQGRLTLPASPLAAPTAPAAPAVAQ